MKRMRESPEILVLKFTWPALLFAAVWLWFPATREHIDARIEWVYGVLALMGLVTLLRLRVALRRPGAKVLKYMPVFDAAALAVLIRLTGGVRSDMWLFYYLMLIEGALDPRQRTIEVSGPLVIASYLAATFSDALVDPNRMEIVGARLFFLLLTAVLARQIARSRNELSEELSRLSEQLALEQERNRIAREIHDGVGHSLVNCILTLELCEKLLCRSPEEARRIVEQEKADLRTALEDMRDYVRQLRPAEIENEPLVTLVRRYLDRFGERTGLTARLRIRSREIDLPPSSRLVMLRILQEALTNAAKHSDATEVQVSLARTGNRGVHCIVEDNGRGFDETQVLRDAASRQGFGLRTMRERAASVGGDAQIESVPGSGTRVSIYVPG